MKLSTRARYSLRLMVEIARRSEGGAPVSLAQAARGGDLPRRYLEQLVIGLKSADLLRGVSGKDGGYYLARPAADIRVGEIIEAAMGPIRIVDCVEDPRECMRADFCQCRTVYALINRRISEVLHEFTLEDLARKGGLQRGMERLEGKAAAGKGSGGTASRARSGRTAAGEETR
ncbi:MAG: Rrf2 family transcriptional regulator [Deltaproteobacteria bacterium]|nr:Rrf2 family transcriptional regulator [Deltaproteobacteria bacterium]